MYDVAIVGAGPAGATLARLIGKEFKVLLIDKRQLDCEPKSSGVVKCCGGLVAPDAQKVMAELGLGLPSQVITGPQLFAVRTIDISNKLERFYQRFYINIDRERFDRWLVSLLPPKVDIRLGSIFKGYLKEDNAFKVIFSYNGRKYTEKARMVVGADGAFSMVRRQLAPKAPLPGRYVSIQEWFECEKVLPYFSAIFDDEITDFYSWTIPKENHLVIGSALVPQKDTSSKFQLLKEKLGGYGFELGKCVKREGAFILRPGSTGQIHTGTAGVALIGEAAGWISPSSAEGLSYAFRSAMALAESMQRDFENSGSYYNRLTRSIRNNILVKNLKSPFMYNSCIRCLVMRSGIESIDTHG